MKKLASRLLTGLLLSATAIVLIPTTARAQGNLPPKVSAANNYISLLSNEAGLVPSYDPPQYQTDGNNYKWTGGDTRTIYNPLDGGIFLQYKPTSFGNSDGCSGGLPEHKKKFFEACFAHDHNWDAPLRQMGFPQYRWNSIKTGKLEVTDSGKDLADYLFLKDMLRLGTGSIDKTAAESFYTAVLHDNGYRDDRGNAVISQRGGGIVVRNQGAYVMGLKVSWISPQGVQKEVEVKQTGTIFDRAVAIPLSVGATNIVVECWAVGGKRIFKESLTADKVHTFTVSGTTIFPTLTTSNSDKRMSYDVSIKTGNKTGAGTDSNIYLTMSGVLGRTQEIQINQFISGNAFERNQTDRFTLKNIPTIGEFPRSIKIRSDGKFAGAAWYLESITINGKTARFDRWIESGKLEATAPMN